MKAIEFIKKWYYYFKFRLTNKKYEGTRLLTRKISFEKEGNCWYAVLSEWKGPKGALLMVAGADLLLDELSAGKKFITLVVSNDFEQWEIWNRRRTHNVYVAYATSDSGNYHVKPIKRDIWLCGVMVFVFGYYPSEFYFYVED